MSKTKSQHGTDVRELISVYRRYSKGEISYQQVVKNTNANTVFIHNSDGKISGCAKVVGSGKMKSGGKK